MSEHCRAETKHNLAGTATQYGLRCQTTPSVSAGVDIAKVDFLSGLAITSTSTLPDFVR
ncbi:hypothetical protein JG688_00014391 [Phytophthora aleatoria]|uniref:Uncharacterized protein n=1 Tax=Phytophthora aleatoria TaxID=2496075 RepID=A0A8J5J0L5_9STRA|nr:hypothetical protein JG688_00014391 [Phytophthora aleatoria]